VNVEAAASGHASATLDLQVSRRTDLPPPKSLQEVGDRLNEIRGDLNRLEESRCEETGRIEHRLETEVERVTREAGRGAERLDDRIAEQTRQTLADRKREGAIFLVGVLCQIAGAVLLLTC